jgi:Domain of unknown function (DUF4194)
MSDEFIPEPLWANDIGTLPEKSRRALLELVKGPYLSREASQQNWETLLADEGPIKSRLNDMFLELVIDREAEFAFARNAIVDEIELPKAARTVSLTFVDTLMLLELRRTMLASQDARPYVDKMDIFYQLQTYRPANKDEISFTRNLNAAWGRMQNTLRVTHSVGQGDDRVEISPILRLIIDADQARALQAAFEKAAASGIADDIEEDGEE